LARQVLLGVGSRPGVPALALEPRSCPYRSRRWDTRAGEINLQIPKLRQGSYFPSYLKPRRRSEQALLALVQQSYVCVVSTRRVDHLVESVGLRISKSEVSRVCEALDASRRRTLERTVLTSAARLTAVPVVGASLQRQSTRRPTTGPSALRSDSA